MNTDYDIDKRVSVLEKSMEWAQGSIQKIDRDLDIIKNTQFQMLERISSLQAHTDERISSLQAHTDERISSLQAHTDERISSLQAHTDERISSLQAHTDEKFIEVHKEISGIHHAISVQTKWLLSMILAAAGIISILHPLMLKLIG